jgi:hypothetical protein
MIEDLCDFCQFLATKLAFSSNTNVMHDHFLRKTISNSVKR